jgi:hypothetical protein
LEFGKTYDFFMSQELPQPQVHPDLLLNVNYDTMEPGHPKTLVNHLDFAMIPALGETFVDDYSRKLFEVLGYANGGAEVAE